MDTLLRGISFMSSQVNHPQHYNHGNLEVIDIIKDQLSKAPLDAFAGGLMFNIIKYVLRAPYKANEIEDLNKAVWYLNTLIKYLGDDNNGK
ncbi:hypothetical protein LpeD_156 [Lactobacillus phage LpeD]|uniref:DUF3310 domain-containing protein n=1 Tax=Lactobacillus phage LpeD TaxID=2041210 RepID=A0A291I9Q2_9CAUD|nr:nucleotide kinase [Lactobacillus phage LpeD]ATG86399.1 hypothetical protein LpeD_156 [Lactobacillus phage LpeD]